MTLYITFGKIPRPEWFQFQYLEDTIIIRIVFLWLGFAIVKIDIENCIQNMLDALHDKESKSGEKIQ